MKEKLIHHYGNQIQFVSPLDQTKSLLVFPTVSVETAVRGSEESGTNLNNASVEEDILEAGIEDKEEAFLKAANLVATKIRFDVKDTPGHNSYEGLHLEHKKAVIPDSLFLVLQLLVHGCEEHEILMKPAQFKSHEHCPGRYYCSIKWQKINAIAHWLGCSHSPGSTLKIIGSIIGCCWTYS